MGAEYINISTCWETFGELLQQQYCKIKTLAGLSLVPAGVSLASGFPKDSMGARCFFFLKDSAGELQKGTLQQLMLKTGLDFH